ncbi:MAG: 50S ribosomal protein L4 [Sphingobacteriia bacterium]|jgi:large subunit ribosomal protein L4
MEAKVYKLDGKESGKVQLADEIFGIQPNDHAIYQDVRLIQANRRQGTHLVKERGDVQGSKKKPFRQKGTGGARAGHKRSPLWRHGGTVHGPRPRDYGFKLNKKVKQLARKSALSYKAQEAKIRVLEDFALANTKTKDFEAMLKANQLAGVKTLIVTSNYDKAFFNAGRNLENTYIVHASQLNTYDILNADTLLVAKEAVDIIHNQFA